MNYHLNRHGQNLGVLPLDEIVRRRMSGELNGSELAWREGMAQWEALDSVLRRDAPGSIPVAAPPAIQSVSRSKSTRLLLWILGVCAVLFIGGIVLFGFLVVGFVKEVRNEVLQATTETGDAVSIASEPLIWNTNTLTDADVTKLRNAFRARQWVGNYEQHGLHDKPWDADATRLMKLWSGEIEGNDSELQTRALAEKLLAAGCDDALVLTIAAVRAIERFEGESRLERALRAFEKSGYKAYPRLYAVATMANKASQRNHLARLDAEGIKHFEQMFKDGSLRGEDQEQMARYLIEGWGEKFFERNRTNALQILRDAGKDFEWLALVMEGEFHIIEAWRARGGGYANTVSSDGWDGFSGHLDLARNALTNAWNLRPDLVSAPRRMIYVSLGSSDLAEMREWFDRVTELQLDYSRAWADMRWGLRPRWHGSHEALLAFGAMAVDSGRFDTDVPRQMFECVNDVESELELPIGKHIYGRRDVWPDLELMYEGYIAEPARAAEQKGWRSAFAAAAFIAGKLDVSRAQLEALDWKPLNSSLKNWQVNLAAMPLEVAARTGPCARLVADAENNRNIGDLKSAVKIYNSLSDITNTDERTFAFSKLQLALLDQEQRLAKGEWIPLLPNHVNDGNWTITWGRPVQLAADTLALDCGPEGHLLYPRLRPGRDFEVRGEFEIVKTSNGDFQAGLVMGMPDCDSDFRSQAWYAFRIKRNKREGDIVSFSKAWTSTQVRKNVRLNADRNTFTFRLQNGKATATVNGVEVLTDANVPQEFDFPDENFHVGLGAYNDTNETTIRYRNMQIRQLQLRGNGQADQPFKLLEVDKN